MNFSKKIISMTLFGGAVLASGSALAKPSNPAEFRGYSKCVDMAQQSSRGLTTNRNYLTSATDSERAYFINGSRWEDGDRVRVRINCETSLSGRTLFSQNIDRGQFRNSRGSVTVEVAER
jgi:hypothetical protein